MSKIAFNYKVYKDRDVWRTIANLGSDIQIVVSEKGVDFFGVDQAMICCFGFHSNVEFEEKPKKEEKFVVDSNFANILLTFDEPKLEFLDSRIRISEGKTEFTLPTIGEQIDVPDVSSLTWENSFELNFDEVKNFLKRTNLIPSPYDEPTIYFSLEKGSLNLVCGDTFKVVQKNLCVGLDKFIKEDFKVGISKNYLDKIKVGKKIYIKKDYPIKLEEDGFFVIIAPRVEDEELEEVPVEEQIEEVKNDRRRVDKKAD